MITTSIVLIVCLFGHVSSLQCYKYHSTNATYTPSISEMTVESCQTGRSCMKVASKYNQTLDGVYYSMGTTYACGDHFQQTNCPADKKCEIDRLNQATLVRCCCSGDLCATPSGFKIDVDIMKPTNEQVKHRRVKKMIHSETNISTKQEIGYSSSNMKMFYISVITLIGRMLY